MKKSISLFLAILLLLSLVSCGPKIRPDIKAAIDSYEDFIDEYYELVDNYDEPDSSVLQKIIDLSSRMVEMESKFLEIKDKKLTQPELEYYQEVNLRCIEKYTVATQKAAEIIGNGKKSLPDYSSMTSEDILDSLLGNDNSADDKNDVSSAKPEESSPEKDNSDDETSIPEDEPAATTIEPVRGYDPRKKWTPYPAGTYKAGRDGFSAGEYILYAIDPEKEAYYKLESEGKTISESSFSTNIILLIGAGETVTLTGCYAVPDSQIIYIDVLKEGMYKVGVHIPVGRIYVVPDGSGLTASAELTFGCRHTAESIISSETIYDETYIDTGYGQYLYLKHARLKKTPLTFNIPQILTLRKFTAFLVLEDIEYYLDGNKSEIGEKDHDKKIGININDEPLTMYNRIMNDYDKYVHGKNSILRDFWDSILEYYVLYMYGMVWRITGDDNETQKVLDLFKSDITEFAKSVGIPDFEYEEPLE